MLHTVEAMIDEAGNVRLLEPLHLSSTRRALVTILDTTYSIAGLEPALLSEPALAADWNRPEEDEAWSHLQGLSWNQGIFNEVLYRSRATRGQANSSQRAAI